MSSSQERISKAQAAVVDAEQTVGKDHVEVSYKLDELASALKESGRLLEAANASARARAIRTAWFSRESKEQAQKYGDASAGNQGLSAAGWLRKLHRMALIGSAVVLAIIVFFRTSTPEMHTIREIAGPSAAAILLQLLLYPIKSVPRIIKLCIVVAGTGMIWMLVGG